MGDKLLYLVRHGEYGDDQSLTEVGRQQAKLLGQRLNQVDFDAMHHSTMGRAAETAGLISGYLADVPVRACELLRECIPTVPDRAQLTAGQAEFFDSLPPEILREGPVQAAAMAKQYATSAEEDTRELVVSHGNLINWLVCEALGAGENAWLNLLEHHCGLTVLMYRADAPPKLVMYNDIGHLPVSLRGAEHPPSWRV